MSRPRWMAPLNVVDVEDDPRRMCVYPDGEVRREANVTFTEDTYMRLAHGYVCCRCYEPHDQAFPEACSLCSFPIRKEQRAVLDLEFDGLKWIGPSRETISRWEEQAEMEERARKSGIVIPGARGKGR